MHMNLHSKGQEELIKELKQEKDKEIKQVKESESSEIEKRNLIQKILLKFNHLIKDTDQSLFLKQAQNQSR